MNAIAENTHLNGIDNATQRQIMTALGSKPELAQVGFKASNTWENGTRTQSRISQFSMAGQANPHSQEFTLQTDLPKPFLGTDTAPTPAEYALHALASCMNSTMVYNCAARGIEIRSSKAVVEGDLDARGFLRVSDETNAGYQAVRIRFEVETDAPRETIEDLIKGSPMFDVFTRPIPASVDLDIKS